MEKGLTISQAQKRLLEFPILPKEKNWEFWACTINSREEFWHGL